jgi:hypothetical protein
MFQLDYDYWEHTLGRSLRKKEYILIKKAKCEKGMNESIELINRTANKNGLCVKNLTENDGNCLFNSLCHLGLATTLSSLKKSIANLMIFFKDVKNFIPDQEMSLAELFPLHNDVEFVFCCKQKKIFKYTYDAMCMDIMTNDGWTRINTQMILTALSVALNVKFVIYHDNGHKTEISTQDNENTRSIFLGQIEECHYIPLDIIKDDSNDICPVYDGNTKKFVAWAERIFIMKFGNNLASVNNDNKYIQSDESDSDKHKYQQKSQSEEELNSPSQQNWRQKKDQDQQEDSSDNNDFLILDE